MDRLDAMFDDSTARGSYAGLYPTAEPAGRDARPVLSRTSTERERRFLDRRPIIPTETAWRRIERHEDVADAMKVTASRWLALADQPCAAAAETPSDSHLVKIVLRTMNFSLHVDGKRVHDGTATPGMVHVTEPGTSAKCLFRGPFDTLHLHVPNALVAECLSDMPAPHGPQMAVRPGLTSDSTIERLARSLLAADQRGDSLGPLYADCIGTAIVARLLSATQARRGSSGDGLPPWRLRRTIDYIEDRFAEPIRLADMAAAAGLTRMHFAAQFRAATGLRPHEYLLRRRIERAQQMLLITELPLIEIALTVGFQSQSHFTSVFGHLVGQTPRSWRAAQTVRWADGRV